MRTAERMRLEASKYQALADGYRQAAARLSGDLNLPLNQTDAASLKRLRDKVVQLEAEAAELRRSADWHDAQEIP
jgi:hypothetical protein